ncbi:hypothetical protein PROFUN_07166 [Planoprotostelium fungivorum]|uniref:Uncharacterized protein n=1 Tax=Planoprotostelium fungivorum TaxID=1890364 RepID=A0A2P6NM98_9EUKA|nr:hypothetical protein PROFUN_07166 [Planoprotostelium fungivorum]
MSSLPGKFIVQDSISRFKECSGSGTEPKISAEMTIRNSLGETPEKPQTRHLRNPRRDT